MAKSGGFLKGLARQGWIDEPICPPLLCKKRGWSKGGAVSKSFFRRLFLSNQDGATPTEYALLAALVAVVVIGVIVSGALPK